MASVTMLQGELPEELEVKVKDTEKELYISDENLDVIMKKLLSEMKKGLSKETNPDAKVKMIPSFVESLPDGTERGYFLALDLGGTNFRVLLVKILDGKGKPKPSIEMDSQIYTMPEHIITGDGEKLFDHIALCMAEFLGRLHLKDQKLPVGFTFSFPCKQEGLNHAALITWTKGFSAKGVVGKDVVKLLREALRRRGDIDVDIIAVVNDTVGTLMSCSYDYEGCYAGLIIGTGSNACYMEKKSNIELIESNEGNMVINMEWGAFGDDGILDEFRNEYDVHVDQHSLNKGKQLYEKMISGMYMGEIVRLVLCKLTRDGTIFNGVGSEKLFQKGIFETSYVSQIESAVPNGVTAVQNILAKLDIGAMNTDCEVVVRVCQAVSKRAAYLCSAGIAAVARKIKMNNPNHPIMNITVGVDGTVYKKHPTFSKMMSEKVAQLVQGAGVTVDFALSYDGSGKGAALITAVAHRMKRPSRNSTH